MRGLPVAFNIFQRISKSPTNPQAQPRQRDFDVAELFDGPIGLRSSATAGAPTLDEKLRQAYFWIVNNAIISPHYDIEFNDGAPLRFSVGDSKSTLNLPSAQSYSSYVLLPLLTFATRSKCLFVGGPGRGKTASAILMGILGGYSAKEVKRAMQHGHPQMTIADLLGNPLPADLVAAQSMDDIRIDEYNRIPTRTQSALLTVMGDNYAEVLNHIFECPDAAWYLTANDDQGGGTYQVIEALRDRIDVIVQALSFNPRFMGDLLLRIEGNVKPEELVPREIIFASEEVDQITSDIRDIAVPEPVRRRLEFFSSQFELFEGAGEQFEYMTKDTARLSRVDWGQIVSADQGRDRLKDLGCQTLNGLSVRNLMTLIKFAKALSYFRGDREVSLEDVRQILPFVLNDKLHPDVDAPFFALPENAAYRVDRLSWLRHLFEFSQGLDGLSERDVRSRLTQIERIVGEHSKGRKLYGHLYDDLLKLKYLHQRYTNYLHWLRSQ
jgi:MoxR-like ATPase